MRQSKPIQINSLLLLFVKEFRLEQGLMENRVIDLWDELMGKNIARATVKKNIVNKVLYIHLNSSIVRQELFMMRTEVVKELNRRAGGNVIDELVLK